MSLNVNDILALAHAGFNAAQIGAINSAAIAAESTPSTPSTPSTDLSTPTPQPIPSPSPSPAAPVPQPAPAAEAAPTPQPAPVSPAPTAGDRPAATAPQEPTMQDLMAKLAKLENTWQRGAILADQQPGQQAPLTGDTVLARILDPTQE